MPRQAGRLVIGPWLFPMIVSVMVAGCVEEVQTRDTSSVNDNQLVAVATPVVEQDYVAPQSEQPFSSACAGGDTGYRSFHNFPSAGYHGGIWKCSNGVETQLAIWTGQQIFYGFASSACPDKSFDAVADGREVLDIRESRHHVAADVQKARMFLEKELVVFRSQCGLPELSVDGSFAGLEGELEKEVVRSWVQNRYGQLRGGGSTNDALLKQAQREYEELR